MQIDKRKIPLGEMRSYVERNFRPLAQQKDIDFDISIHSEVPPTITSDPQRLEQILKNLLSNAFKFTEQGRIDLDISLVTDDRGFKTQALKRAHAVIAFAVTDTGIGIAEDKQQVIFEAFQQADASTSRSYGGTGLGLTISRELARLLGGEIFLRSSPGAGSTFTLFLPLTQADSTYPSEGDDVGHYERTHEEPLMEARTDSLRPERVETSAAQGERAMRDAASPLRLHGGPAPLSPVAVAPELAGKKVLVVDDDVRNLFAVTSLLERQAMKVMPAASGREAIEMLAANPDVDVVLMDIMMPEMDGYEATREIRKDLKFQALPIIALTAKAMPGDREKTLEAGCSDFVPKPVERQRLISTLRSWLSRKDE